MGLFDKLKKDSTQSSKAEELLSKHEKGELSDSEFIKEFGRETIYYTTPFGDHKDGSKKLFVIPSGERTGYNPVFSSEQKIKDYYEKVGRAAYMIIEGNLPTFIEVTMKVNAGNTPIKMGVIIDPGTYGVTVDVGALEMVLNMMR